MTFHSRYCEAAVSDSLEGVMAKNAGGRMAMAVVRLRPQVAFAGSNIPDEAVLRLMHHEAHEECFVASSVKTEVICEALVV